MGDLYPQIIQPIHCVHSSIGTLKQALPCLRVWIFNTDPGERERRISCYTANENMSEKLSLENELLCVLKRISKWYFVTKLYWPTVRKNCPSDREKLLKFEAEVREFAKTLRSLEPFIRTMKSQNNFWKKNE